MIQKSANFNKNSLKSSKKNYKSTTTMIDNYDCCALGEIINSRRLGWKANWTRSRNRGQIIHHAYETGIVEFFVAGNLQNIRETNTRECSRQCLNLGKLKWQAGMKRLVEGTAGRSLTVLLKNGKNSFLIVSHCARASPNSDFTLYVGRLWMSILHNVNGWLLRLTLTPQLC